MIKMKMLFALLVCGALGLGSASSKADDHMASDQLVFSGTMEMQAGIAFAKETDDVKSPMGVFDVNGYASIPLGSNWSMQLDVQSEYFVSEVDENPLFISYFGSHLSYRDSNKLLGVFAAGAVARDQSEETDANAGYLLGVEGQWYASSDVTLYGQVGYANILSDISSEEGFNDGWFYRMEGRYFMSDDHMITANISYAHTKTYIDGDDKGRFIGWGLKSMMKLTDSYPLYFTLEYRGNHYDSTTEGDNTTDHTFLIGIKALFGASSLKHNDRNGATLDMNMLPGRASAMMEALD